MKYGLSEKQLNEILDTLSKYPEIEKAVLFGSRAIDTYKAASDVDIAIQGENVDMFLAAKLKDDFEEETYLPFFFDVVAYNSIKSEKLKQHIKDKGVVLYRKGVNKWKKYRLGKYVEVINGFAFKSKKFVAKPQVGLLPVVKIKNVANGDVHLNNIQYHEFSEKLNRYLICYGDILLALTGNHPHAMTQVVGEVSRYKLNEKALLNQRVAKIESKHGLNKNYLYYFLKDDATHDYLANQASGSANQANISKQDIENLEFQLPPLPEQKAIAEVLSSLDDKIDLLHRQNKTLEQMAETLFRQWFVEEAKPDWEEGVLFDEFDFLMGQSPKGSTFNEDGIGTPMYQGNADFNFRFPNRRVYTSEAKRLAHKYETLISVRAPVGEQNMALEKCCIGRGVAAFKYKADSKYYTYVYYKMRSLMDEIKQFNNEGTVFGSISKSDFQLLSITIPPRSLVDKFQNEAKPIDDKVIENTMQILTIEKLRDTLLPKLISGKVRIIQ